MARSAAPASVIGWQLDPEDRRLLLARFPAFYPRVIADHVTLGKAPETTPLPIETSGEIVGQVDDDAGLQALVLRIGGTTGRPDGSTYHITWSLGEGREAVQSNEVIARLGWRWLPEPIPVGLIPARF